MDWWVNVASISFSFLNNLCVIYPLAYILAVHLYFGSEDTSVHRSRPQTTGG